MKDFRVVDFDNEREKGDHLHLNGIERPYEFQSVQQLVEDFIAAIDTCKEHMNTRHLTITLRPDWKPALREVPQASLQAQYQGELLNFETPAQFFGQLTEKRWELVRLAQGKEPMAVRELARLAGRDVRRVHDDVTILTQLGLLERNEKSGVVCPYARIHIDMNLQAA